MELHQLIKRLEAADQDKLVKHGFGRGCSYRGYYEDIAFEPQSNVSVGEMAQHARSMVGTTMTGYKGGEYFVQPYTDCWICEYGTTQNSQKLGPLLLDYMLGEA